MSTDTDLDTTPEPHTTGRNGSVTNKDLEILSVRIDAKLERLLDAIGYIQRQIEAAQHAAAKTDEEIATLRERSHAHGNAITTIDLRTSPLTLDTARELAASMPFIRKGADFWERHQPVGMLSEDEQIGVRALLLDQKARKKLEESRAINWSSHLVQWILASFALLSLFFAYILPLLRS